MLMKLKRSKLTLVTDHFNVVEMEIYFEKTFMFHGTEGFEGTLIYGSSWTERP